MTAPDVTWIETCAYDHLLPDRGVCALVGTHQVAIFRLSATDECPDGELFAISNYDPFSKAFVISRGIVGSKGGVPKVASPVFKQSFDLRTGDCLDDPTVGLPTFDVRVRSGIVEVALPSEPVPLVVERDGADAADVSVGTR